MKANSRIPYFYHSKINKLCHGPVTRNTDITNPNVQDNRRVLVGCIGKHHASILKHTIVTQFAPETNPESLDIAQPVRRSNPNRLDTKEGVVMVLKLVLKLIYYC